MEQDEGRLQAGDHHVLVAMRGSAMMALPSCVTRHVFEQPPLSIRSLVGRVRLAPRNGLVELRIRERPAAIDGVEVERWLRVVGRVRGFGYPAEGGRLDRRSGRGR